MRDFKNIYVNIKNLNIHYSVSGAGENLLIIHGLSSSSKLYSNLVKSLEKSHRVFILDLPGFGLSEEPKKPWKLDDYIALIIDFININDIKKCSLVGHSIGGSIIIKMIADYDIDFVVNKIVLMNSNGVRHKNERNITKTRKKRILINRIIFNKLMIKTFPKLGKKYISLFGSYENEKLSKNMKKTIDNILAEDLQKYLPNVFQEILLIWGKNDKETPIDDAYRMRRLFPKCKLESFEKVEHFVFLQQSTKTKELLEKFL